MNTKTINANLPAIALDGSLSKYLAQIKKFPMLSSEEEYMLAKSWRRHRRFKISTKISNESLEVSCKDSDGIQRIWTTCE